MLLNITSGTGLPLQIDQATLSMDIGIYAMVLIDVDVAQLLSERLLVKKKNLKFFVNVGTRNSQYFACIMAFWVMLLKDVESGGSKLESMVEQVNLYLRNRYMFVHKTMHQQHNMDGKMMTSKKQSQKS